MLLVTSRREGRDGSGQSPCNLLVDFRREEFPARKVDAQNTVSAKCDESFRVVRGDCGEQAILRLRLPRHLARVFNDAIFLDWQVRVARIRRCIRDYVSRRNARVVNKVSDFIDEVLHMFFVVVFSILSKCIRVCR